MAAPGTSGEDDLARQRRKREVRLLAQPVAGFPAMTVGDVVTTVMAATEESRGALDVPRFLADRGYSWHTIETVLAYVDGKSAGAVRSDTAVAP